MRINNVFQVAAWRLCTGCGACAVACPKNLVELRNIYDDGIRPHPRNSPCGTCDDCLRVCPGYQTTAAGTNGRRLAEAEQSTSWGPLLEIWEGHANDPDIRRKGSSGGLVTALALYSLEQEKAFGVLHTGSHPDKPWENITCLSRDATQLLSRTGSRYSPASPCDGLDKIEAAPGPCVFVGKPCDLAAQAKMLRHRPRLAAKISLTLGIFCAGTPATQGTIDLLSLQSICPDEVDEIRYRGDGWPGNATIRFKSPTAQARRLTYMKSWGFLQRYRPFRCYLCPDTTAEFADISCGDPWHRQIKEHELGRSLIIVRSERGQQAARKAAELGYITLWSAKSAVLKASQKNLLRKRQAIWGRLLAMKALGVPAPKLNGFHLFKNWMRLGWKDKIRSIAGTVKRIVIRQYGTAVRQE